MKRLRMPHPTVNPITSRRLPGSSSGACPTTRNRKTLLSPH